jgi:hypothetical protein
MKHTLVIRTPEIAARAIEIVGRLHLCDELHEVIIREHKKDRTAAQHSLYWLWLTIIASELGETKDAIHLRYKKKYLVHIYERDDADYAAMIEAVRAVHRAGMKKESAAMERKIVELTSTTTANVAQFSEYLADIEKNASSLGIRLPHPEDVYRISMGGSA